jgi:hypothetical protein
MSFGASTSQTPRPGPLMSAFAEKRIEEESRDNWLDATAPACRLLMGCSVVLFAAWCRVPRGQIAAASRRAERGSRRRLTMGSPRPAWCRSPKSATVAILLDSRPRRSR